MRSNDKYQRNMRKILYAILILSLLSGCAALRQSPEEKAAEMRQVEQCLNERNYRIDVNYMIPHRGFGKVVTGPYSLSVNGSAVDSHLPYLGVAYNVPYGGGKVFTFKDEIDEYQDSGWNKGQRVIAFSTNNDEDIIIYTLTVFNDGSADIYVRCRNREDIRYRGQMNLDRDESEN